MKNRTHPISLKNRTHPISWKNRTDPILKKTPHPITGICWEFLLKIAVRGDLKDRKQPAYFSTDYVEEWE